MSGDHRTPALLHVQRKLPGAASLLAFSVASPLENRRFLGRAPLMRRNMQAALAALWGAEGFRNINVGAIGAVGAVGAGVCCSSSLKKFTTRILSGKARKRQQHSAAGTPQVSQSESCNLDA